MRSQKTFPFWIVLGIFQSYLYWTNTAIINFHLIVELYIICHWGDIPNLTYIGVYFTQMMICKQIIEMKTGNHSWIIKKAIWSSDLLSYIPILNQSVFMMIRIWILRNYRHFYWNRNCNSLLLKVIMWLKWRLSKKKIVQRTFFKTKK